jgi:phage terminase large subunit
LTSRKTSFFLKRGSKELSQERGGKTEVGAVASIILHEQREDYTPNGIDPYLGVIVAPTNEMLTRLSWKKFCAYAQPFIKEQRESPFKQITWHNSVKGDESLIYGVSGERPARIEGLKANWIWIDEVFQCSEQLFLECLARVADTQGKIFCTGSLGVQHINPKQHWAYKYFKMNKDQEFKCFEWRTIDNPYFPKSEIERNKELLDARTFRAMFEIDWDTRPMNTVYEEFDDDNVINCKYNPSLPVRCAIDWGWTHKMAVGIFQYDQNTNTVYQIDELVQSKLLLENVLTWIRSRPYQINEYCCDMAGNQTREQTGQSNIDWFALHGIYFKFKKSSISYGVSIVRSYIKNAIGVRRYFVNPKCTETIDSIRRYKYQDKDGVVINENPLKIDDDACDMVRYYFYNFHDPRDSNTSFITFE